MKKISFLFIKKMSESLTEKYSKWDHLVVSSDDEDDCHPNIDIKLWKRLQKEKRERERTEQDDRIEALRARIDAVRFFFSPLRSLEVNDI